METKTTSSRRKRTSPQEKQKIIESYRQSGLSPKEFVKSQAISLQTFYKWLRKPSASQKARPFVPIPNLFSEAARPGAYRFHAPRGLSLEVHTGFKFEEVQALITLL